MLRFLAMVQAAEFVLSPFEGVFLLLRQILPGAINIKAKHGHRGLKWLGFPTRTVLRRTLQRSRNFLRAGFFKYRTLEIERVARLVHMLRPAFQTL